MSKDGNNPVKQRLPLRLNNPNLDQHNDSGCGSKANHLAFASK